MTGRRSCTPPRPFFSSVPRSCIRLRQVSRVAVGMLFLSASSKACCRLKESGRAAKRPLGAWACESVAPRQTEAGRVCLPNDDRAAPRARGRLEKSSSLMRNSEGRKTIPSRTFSSGISGAGERPGQLRIEN